jgi:hypothetical protein
MVPLGWWDVSDKNDDCRNVFEVPADMQRAKQEKAVEGYRSPRRFANFFRSSVSKKVL